MQAILRLMGVSAVLFLFTFNIAFSLTCKSGASARTIIKNVHEWKETECIESNHVCMRVEAIFMIMSGLFSVSTDLGGCQEPALCNQSCSNILQLLYQQAKEGGAYLPFDVSRIAINTRSCDMECCRGSSCNAADVAKMRKTNLEKHQDYTTVATSSKSIDSTSKPRLYFTKQTDSSINDDDQVVVPKLRTIHPQNHVTHPRTYYPLNATSISPFDVEMVPTQGSLNLRSRESVMALACLLALSLIDFLCVF